MVRGAGILPLGPGSALFSQHPCLATSANESRCEWMAKRHEVVFPRSNWGSCAMCVEKRITLFLNSHGPQVPLNFPDISLASFHFTLREKEEEAVWKKHRSSATLTAAEPHRNLAKRESGRKISPEFSRKPNPICSFQCRKWYRITYGSCCAERFWTLSLFTFTSSGNQGCPSSLCFLSGLPKLRNFFKD